MPGWQAQVAAQPIASHLASGTSTIAPGASSLASVTGSPFMLGVPSLGGRCVASAAPASWRLHDSSAAVSLPTTTSSSAESPPTAPGGVAPADPPTAPPASPLSPQHPPILWLDADLLSCIAMHLEVADVLALSRTSTEVLACTSSRAVWATHLANRFGDEAAWSDVSEGDGRTLFLHRVRDAWMSRHPGDRSEVRQSRGILLCK